GGSHVRFAVPRRRPLWKIGFHRLPDGLAGTDRPFARCPTAALLWSEEVQKSFRQRQVLDWWGECQYTGLGSGPLAADRRCGHRRPPHQKPLERYSRNRCRRNALSWDEPD